MLELVSGGSGSGKSEYAENLAVNAHRKEGKGKLYYIATMVPADEESRERVKRHRSMRRGKGFTTIFCDTHLAQISVARQDVVLLECLSNLLANEMFGKQGRLKEQRQERLSEVLLTPLFALAGQAAHMVVVTNEVFSDGAVYEKETEEYLRLLGRANCRIGERAERVIEVVCGIPLIKKGENLCCNRW